MVYGFTERSGAKPNWHQLKHAILRNFGGLDKVDPVPIFEGTLIEVDKNAKVGTLYYQKVYNDN